MVGQPSLSMVGQMSTHALPGLATPLLLSIYAYNLLYYSSEYLVCAYIASFVTTSAILLEEILLPSQNVKRKIWG